MPLNLAKEVAAMQRMTPRNSKRSTPKCSASRPTPTTGPGLSAGSRGGSGPSPAERTPESVAAVARMQHSIAMLEEHASGEPHAEPWAYLEYYCHVCVLRMSWTGFVTAFFDPDYDRQFQQVLDIERGRHGLPRTGGRARM